MQCGRIHFTLTKIMNKFFSTENQVFIALVGPSENRKWQPIYNWLKVEIIQPKFEKIYFFINNSNLCTILCKKKLKILSLCVE